MLQLDSPPLAPSAEVTEIAKTFSAKNTGTERRKALESLVAGDLDFKGQDSVYASHNFHAFAAKFPPQLPRWFIEGLTLPGEVVLDPMMGSGTALLESYLLNRQAVGCDFDPLAVRQSRGC